MKNATDVQLDSRIVLIAEDEVIIGLLAKSAIESFGGRCLKTARSCDEALSTLAANRPDLILLDLNLQGGTSERVLDTAIADGIPVLVSSGTGHTSLPTKFQELPLLKKPWTVDEMSDALASVLQL